MTSYTPLPTHANHDAAIAVVPPSSPWDAVSGFVRYLADCREHVAERDDDAHNVVTALYLRDLADFIQAAPEDHLALTQLAALYRENGDFSEESHHCLSSFRDIDHSSDHERLLLGWSFCEDMVCGELLDRDQVIESTAVADR